jgi:pilus assembly protein CpaF
MVEKTAPPERTGDHFAGVCRLVENSLAPDAAPAGSGEAQAGLPDLDAQKRAIIGYPADVTLYMKKIADILDAHGLRGTFDVPSWYESEEDAIFQEVWGRAGMAEWWRPPYDQCPSAKIIGDDIYFLVDGKMRLMPQRIHKHRRDQLIRGFLLLSPEERLDRDFHEIYLVDGSRITVFKGSMAKSGRDTVIFRRYVIPAYSFAEQALRGTIPEEAIPVFESMVHVGYNVVFCGAVRSAKTTFLATWQSCEDPALEGVMVETDPEIPLHRLIPGAPIVQLIADGDRLRMISKNLLRSDADYFIIAEARDGFALDTAVRACRKGTGHMKMTFHTRDPRAFPEDAAIEIVRAEGGNVHETAVRVAGSFDYLFHFISERATTAKKLNGIFEMGVVPAHTDGFTEKEALCGYYVREICRYDRAQDRWHWTCRIAADKRQRGLEEDPAAFAAFEGGLRTLAERSA